MKKISDLDLMEFRKRMLLKMREHDRSSKEWETYNRHALVATQELDRRIKNRAAIVEVATVFGYLSLITAAAGFILLLIKAHII